MPQLLGRLKSNRSKVAVLRGLRPAQEVLAWPFGRHLDALARIYRTDKASTGHGYTQWYTRHLPPRREVRTLLEIGIGGITSTGGYQTTMGGQSLRVWRRRYPKAQIIGLDIEQKKVPGRRIVVEQGSQDDPVFLDTLARRHGPFDVVIDDGSHVGRHVQTSFHALWKHLRPGGVYVVEDLATSYQEPWDGGPPGAPGTHSELLRDCLDAVLRAYWDTSGQAPDVAELHVYDQIAFLTKAR